MKKILKLLVLFTLFSSFSFSTLTKSKQIPYLSAKSIDKKKDVILENIFKYNNSEADFACESQFQEINGLVVMEAENLTYSSSWTVQNSNAGFTGSGYLVWLGPQYFSVPGNGLITTTIFINNPGIYRFQFRSAVGRGTRSSEHNDTWVRFPNASDFFAEKDGIKIFPRGSGKTPTAMGSGSGGWFKAFASNVNWAWGTQTNDNNGFPIFVQFDSPGEYIMELSARSSHHQIDRIILHQNASQPTSLNNSETKCNLSPQNPISVTGINISPTDLSLLVGNNQQFSAAILPSNATNKTVTWSSSDPDVASINSNGLVSGISEGTATISAITVDGNFIANSTITVFQNTQNLSVAGFTLINPTNSTDILEINDGLQISLDEVQNQNLNFRVNTNPSSVGSVFISLSGPVNASRTDNGFAYTLFNNSGINLTEGNYTLTAIPYTQTNRGGLAGDSLTLQFSIVGSVSVPVSGISVTPTNTIILAGNSQQISAIVSPSNATNKTIVWSTSDASIATVNPSGLVFGIAAGLASITARTEDGDFSSILSVTVSEKNSNLGLVGHWKMEEGSGNILIDHTGNENDAIIQNTSGINWSQGVIGLAVNLTGQSGRFGIATHNPSLQINEALSIVSWVKPTSVGRNTIISKADGNGFELWLDQNGQIEFRLNRGNNGAAYRLLSNYNYIGDVGEWIHVAATFDGTTSRIFINGIEDISATYAPFTIGTASGDLTIGALGTIQRFNGAIDDLRLYGRALDGSEISGLFDGEIPLPVVPQLLAPADGNASVIAPEVQLSWLTSDFAAGYQVQLATDIGFGSMVADVDNGPDIIFNATGLLPETAYFWRVRAYNGEGSSDWSETRSFATVADGQVPDGPVGHWKMDEGSGNVLIDHSGNGNNATIQNTANVFWEPGIIGLAVNFNSWSGRYGVAPHSQSLEIAEALSIVSWVKPTSVGRNTIISKADGNGFELWLDQNGQIEFRLNRGNNGAAYRLLSNYNYTGDVGEWIHVAATFDGTTSRIFINGIEDISATYAPFTIGNPSGDLTIGSLGTIQRFNGAIDDLRLYGRALDISEITDLYTNASNIARKSEGSVKEQINDEAQLSIEDPENDAMFGFKIYPNPVEDRLHIQLNSREETTVGVMVYDMMGRQYINRSAVPENGEIVLDLAPVRMAAGTYLLILDQGYGSKKHIKFIKK
ncbi:Por secretion system C-terminal sorting domain-containing protein [Aquiflexum balticum DSM 16537]|uniref:Por secretion system C-terminal sorting domain-containing protein n=1 Tax=Aquiflexum balticum DSM 16537 TaxID=758820 RepID=A0A1W2HBP7_9BACT|nr:LamG-like jellyroll fold domain-containing protein [Aquiflexum balticum]SMD46300.1 Por secretion system C-terminal sorting domain-containing protein [Aquiflexum balticum DSM 16537]